MKKLFLLFILIALEASSQNLPVLPRIAGSSGWVNTLRKTFQTPFSSPTSLKDSLVSVYDSQCNLTQRSYYRRNTSNVFILILEYTYFNYDSLGNALLFAIQNFDNTSGVSLTKFKTSYSYHQSNLLGDTTYQEFSGNWYPAVAYDYFYTGNQPDSSFTSKYDTALASWALDSKIYFPLVDAQNRPLKKLQYFLSGTSSFELNQLDSVVYLNATSELLSYEKNVQYSNNLPYTSSAKRSNYDSFENLTQSKTFLWNSPQISETLIDSSLYFYSNPALKLVSDSSYGYTYDGTTGAFQLVLRGKNTFDSNSNYINFSYDYSQTLSGPFTPFVKYAYEWSACTPTAIPQVFDNNTPVFYPNPSNGKITFEGSISSYELYSIQGQLIASGDIAANQETIDFSSLQKGIYFLRLSNSKNALTEKMIIE